MMHLAIEDRNYTDLELIRHADSAGFTHVQVWIDPEGSSEPKKLGIETARIFQVDGLEARRGV